MCEINVKICKYIGNVNVPPYTSDFFTEFKDIWPMNYMSALQFPFYTWSYFVLLCLTPSTHATYLNFMQIHGCGNEKVASFSLFLMPKLSKEINLKSTLFLYVCSICVMSNFFILTYSCEWNTSENTLRCQISGQDISFWGAFINLMKI